MATSSTHVVSIIYRADLRLYLQFLETIPQIARHELTHSAYRCRRCVGRDETQPTLGRFNLTTVEMTEHVVAGALPFCTLKSVTLWRRIKDRDNVM